ncbi:EamA family transporter [Brachyspira sp.]|uniref:EamA family transporter n=1 Tax=Brachyspira sp. TaxID=1977261 RepID=UPI003D7CF86E
MYLIYALMSSIFASLTAIFIKLGLSDINSNLATAIRTIIILIMSWIIVFYTNSFENIKSINSKNLIFLIVSGITTGLSWIFYFKALQIGDVAKVTVIDKLSIVFTIILAFIFLKETISLKMIIGIVLIFAGTLIISL